MARKVHNSQAGLSQDINLLVEVWMDKVHSEKKVQSQTWITEQQPLTTAQPGHHHLVWVEMGLLGPVGVDVAGSSS